MVKIRKKSQKAIRVDFLTLSTHKDVDRHQRLPRSGLSETWEGASAPLYSTEGE